MDKSYQMSNFNVPGFVFWFQKNDMPIFGRLHGTYIITWTFLKVPRNTKFPCNSELFLWDCKKLILPMLHVLSPSTRTVAILILRLWQNTILYLISYLWMYISGKVYVYLEYIATPNTIMATYLWKTSLRKYFYQLYGFSPWQKKNIRIVANKNMWERGVLRTKPA